MTDTKQNWVHLPKIELHTHLDCALSYQSVQKLAGPMSQEVFSENFRAPRRCEDLVSFLKCIDNSIDLMQSAEALTLAAEDIAKQMHDDNVVYAEVRFAPHLHIRKELNLEGAVEAVLAGFATAALPVGLLLCTLRPYSTEQGMQVLSLAEKYRDLSVVGIDLANDEKNYPLTNHIPVFEKARDSGIHYTMHAGEAVGAESVRETLLRLSPPRIGHGVRAIENAEVMQLLVERGTHLEVCPSVNLQIGLFPSAAAHPIDALRKAGVSVGVNTDARTTTGVTLDDEYQLLAETFGWSDADFREANANALRASFASADLKSSLGGLFEM